MKEVEFYNNLFYTTVTKKEGTVITNRYFYWVRNVLEIAENKTKSAKDVQDIIIDPNYIWIKICSIYKCNRYYIV